MIKRKLNGAKKLNGNDCGFNVYIAGYTECLAKWTGVLTPPGAIAYCTTEGKNAQKTCVCTNNAKWYLDNNSFSSLNMNAGKHSDIEVYNWAVNACKKDPLREIGSSSNETSLAYYQEFIKQTTQAPVTPGGGGGAVIPGSTTTTTTQPQTRAQSFILPALLGAAILLLPFP